MSFTRIAVFAGGPELYLTDASPNGVITPIAIGSLALRNDAGNVSLWQCSAGNTWIDLTNTGSGWTDSGTTVSLTTSTDVVAIGGAAVANRKFSLYETGANEGFCYTAEAANTTSVALDLVVSGEAFSRFKQDVSGSQAWGGGANAADVRLRRLAAGTLGVDNNAGGAATLAVVGTATVTGPTATANIRTTGGSTTRVQNESAGVIGAEAVLVGGVETIKAGTFASGTACRFYALARVAAISGGPTAQIRVRLGAAGVAGTLAFDTLARTVADEETSRCPRPRPSPWTPKTPTSPPTRTR